MRSYTAYIYGSGQPYTCPHSTCPHSTYLGLAKTIYIQFTYSIFGREITKYAVIYGVYIRFWPTRHMLALNDCCTCADLERLRGRTHACTEQQLLHVYIFGEAERMHACLH